MVKRLIISFLFFIAFLTFYCCNRPFATYNVDLFPLEIVRTGDIVFTVGHSWKSDIVRRHDKDNNPFRYSHVGFIYEDNGGGYSIVHMSIDSGMILKQPLDIFCETNGVEDIGIYRLNAPYEIPLLRPKIDSILYLKKEFDYSFSMSNNSQYYCTEFIIKTFQDVNNCLFDEFSGIKLVRPAMLSNSSSIYPILLPNINNNNLEK